MRKIKFKWQMFFILLLVLPSVAFGSSKYYDDGLRLVIDKKVLQDDIHLALKDDRVLVPLRFVSEYLGADVKWQPDERRVDITKNNEEVRIWIDSHLIAYGDGSYGISDVAPIIIDGSTYVPVRLIANALGVYVS